MIRLLILLLIGSFTLSSQLISQSLNQIPLDRLIVVKKPKPLVQHGITYFIYFMDKRFYLEFQGLNLKGGSVKLRGIIQVDGSIESLTPFLFKGREDFLNVNGKKIAGFNITLTANRAGISFYPAESSSIKIDLYTFDAFDKKWYRIQPKLVILGKESAISSLPLEISISTPFPSLYQRVTPSTRLPAAYASDKSSNNSSPTEIPRTNLSQDGTGWNNTIPWGTVRSDILDSLSDTMSEMITEPTNEISFTPTDLNEFVISYRSKEGNEVELYLGAMQGNISHPEFADQLVGVHETISGVNGKPAYDAFINSLSAQLNSHGSVVKNDKPNHLAELIELNGNNTRALVGLNRGKSKIFVEYIWTQIIDIDNADRVSDKPDTKTNNPFGDLEFLNIDGLVGVKWGTPLKKVRLNKKIKDYQPAGLRKYTRELVSTDGNILNISLYFGDSSKCTSKSIFCNKLTMILVEVKSSSGVLESVADQISNKLLLEKSGVDQQSPGIQIASFNSTENNKVTFAELIQNSNAGSLLLVITDQNLKAELDKTNSAITTW